MSGGQTPLWLPSGFVCQLPREESRDSQAEEVSQPPLGNPAGEAWDPMSIRPRRPACLQPGETAKLALTRVPALPVGPGANNSSQSLPQCQRPKEKETRPCQLSPRHWGLSPQDSKFIQTVKSQEAAKRWGPPTCTCNGSNCTLCPPKQV